MLAEARRAELERDALRFAHLENEAADGALQDAVALQLKEDCDE